MRDYPKTVQLRDRRTAVLRPVGHGDFDKLYAFFRGLPEEGRLFLRHNVDDPAVIRRWTDELSFEHVVPLVAEDGDTIVADGTLHVEKHSWMRHVGLIRLVIAETHRNVGLGSLIAQELIAIAIERNLEKLQVYLIEDDHRQREFTIPDHRLPNGLQHLVVTDVRYLSVEIIKSFGADLRGRE